jgi:hypothetical protein
METIWYIADRCVPLQALRARVREGVENTNGRLRRWLPHQIDNAMSRGLLSVVMFKRFFGCHIDQRRALADPLRLGHGLLGDDVFAE